jgi:ferredoxin
MEEKPVMTKYQVIIDKSRCASNGGCAVSAALTFKQGEDRKVEIIDQDGNSDQEKLLTAEACPSMAIKIINTESGEILWPK